MDVERTIKYILQRQAKAKARAHRSETRFETRHGEIKKLLVTATMLLIRMEKRASEMKKAPLKRNLKSGAGAKGGGNAPKQRTRL